MKKCFKLGERVSVTKEAKELYDRYGVEEKDNHYVVIAYLKAYPDHVLLSGEEDKRGLTCLDHRLVDQLGNDLDLKITDFPKRSLRYKLISKLERYVGKQINNSEIRSLI